MQLNELRWKLTQKGIDYRNLWKYLGIGKSTFGARNGVFRQNEVTIIRKLLGLTDEEVCRIFLTERRMTHDNR